ncbi:MAG: dephospho-CoA kinase [Bacilli bacterium]|nr:dephospho-CoA kinase [Bacilli bacterium]
MKIIGITGGIASGKTTVDKMIRKAGYVVIDSDELAHETLLEPTVIKTLVATFGSSIMENDQVNRKVLGEIIFSSPAKQQQLNRIIHPLVKNRIKQEIRLIPNEQIVFVDVPLLYEANMEHDFHKIVVVHIPEKLQIERLMQRDDITQNYAIAKMSRQMSIDEKVKHADFLINNEGSYEDTQRQVEAMIRRIKDEI